MRLLVRTDANERIGIGHAMRMLALAEAWIEQGGDVTFAMHDAPPQVADRIRGAGAVVRDVAEGGEAALVQELQPAVVAVDGYQFGESDHRALGSAGGKVLVVDDRTESATTAADFVLNHNPYATAEMYTHLGPGLHLLVGREFTLLRREFRTARPRPADRDRARRVLVSFGGADVANLTPRAVEALAETDLDVLVIAGPANRHELVSAGAIQIVPAVHDMAAQMYASDLALVAAGSTCWELACCGVPMLAVAVAENQRDVHAAVARFGLGVALPDDPSVQTIRDAVTQLGADAVARAAMARRGPEIIDGRGATRVCDVLREAVSQ